MDENIDNQLRGITAALGAYEQVLDYLLTCNFLAMPRDERLMMAERILDASEKTEWLSGLTEGDEAASERIADIVTLGQDHVGRIVGRALEVTKEAEDRVIERQGRDPG